MAAAAALCGLHPGRPLHALVRHFGKGAIIEALRAQPEQWAGVCRLPTETPSAALELLAVTQQQLTVQQGYRALEHIYVNEPMLLHEHRVALNQVLARVVTSADLVQLTARADELARASTVGLRFADLTPAQSSGGPWTSTFEAQGKPPGMEASPGLNGIEPHPHPVDEPGFVIH